MNNILPLPQVEHMEIHVKPIRTGWYRASATVNGGTYAKASRTDMSWIAAAYHVWKETHGSMAGFDFWVEQEILLRQAGVGEGMPGLDDLDDITIHGGE